MVSVYGQSRLARWLFWVAVAALLPLLPLRGRAQSPDPVTQMNQQASATVAKYCATCHNARIHTAGLVLDQVAIDQVPANAERWEKVIRKVEARSMPPSGAP